MIVLDTCALIFLTLDRGKLSSEAKASIARTDHIIVSAISIWEIGWKHKNGKLKLPFPFLEYVAGIEQIHNIEIHAVDLATWLANLELDWEHRDPADRTIVATAHLLGCELITSDKKILDFYPLAVW